jgi:hypothetical protein
MRFSEFLEGEDGRLSMTRLIVLLTFPPATWVLLNAHDQLVNYLSIYVGGYCVGKASDAFTGGNHANHSKILESDSDCDTDSGDVAARVSSSKQSVQGRTTHRKNRGF